VQIGDDAGYESVGPAQIAAFVAGIVQINLGAQQMIARRSHVPEGFGQTSRGRNVLPGWAILAI
jgi:hypothetical protein